MWKPFRRVEVLKLRIMTANESWPINQRLSQSLYYQLPLGFVLAAIGVGTVFGNVLIITAVLLVKRLHSPSNYLVLSLAFSDFLVAVIVIPLALVTQLRGLWLFSETLCDFFIFSDVLLCTASILNLCSISIDRYMTILKPLSNRGSNIRIVLLMISASWGLSVLISIPPITGWKEPFLTGYCSYSEDLGYQIYATLGAFYIPLIVMLVLYSRIYRVARKIARSQCRGRKLMGIKFPKNGPDDIIFRQFSLLASPLNTLVNSRRDRPPPHKSEAVDSVHSSANELYGEVTSGQEQASHRLSERLIEDGHRRTVCLSSDRFIQLDLSAKMYNNSSGSNKSRFMSQTKAIKTLGILMGCFTVCWFPFFTVQLIVPVINELKYSSTKKVPFWLRDICLWLGYINSFLNPIIYAKFNKDFRQPFREILSCHCTTINSRLRNASYTEQYGLPVPAATSNHTTANLSPLIPKPTTSLAPSVSPISSTNPLRRHGSPKSGNCNNTSQIPHSDTSLSPIARTKEATLAVAITGH